MLTPEAREKERLRSSKRAKIANARIRHDKAVKAAVEDAATGKTATAFAFPLQQAVLAATERIVAVIGGTGSGKTHSARIKLTADFIPAFRGQDGLIVSPSFPNYEKVMLNSTPTDPGGGVGSDGTPRGLVPYLEDTLGWGHMNQTRREFRFTDEACGGSALYFGSADHPMTMEGAHVAWALIDEPGQMGRTAWDIVRRRLGLSLGRILLTGYPLETGGWYEKEVYNRAGKYIRFSEDDPMTPVITINPAGDPDICVIQCSSLSNPFYPRSEYAERKINMPTWQFEQIHMGMFSRAVGAVYPPLLEKPLPKETLNTAQIYLGGDYGGHTGFVVIGWVEDVCWILGASKTTGLTYGENVARVSSIGVNEMGVALTSRMSGAWGDKTAEEAWRMYRQHGLNIRQAPVGGPKSVGPGITRIQEMVKNGKLFVAVGAPGIHGLDGLMTEWDGYHYPTDAEGVVQVYEPVKTNDHLLDALRYAISSSRPPGRKPIIKTYRHNPFWQ